MGIIKESWGQPPISLYKMDVEGENLYATELDHRDRELTCSNYVSNETVYLTGEDLEDLALFDSTFGESTITWEELKRELAKDGLL